VLGAQTGVAYRSVIIAAFLLFAQPIDRDSAHSQDLLETSSLKGMRVALTVDDLPGYGLPLPEMKRLDYADSIIATLRRHHLSHVFGFAVGTEQSPDDLEILRRWRDAGFRLGNHTYLHNYFSTGTADEFIADIRRQDDFLVRLHVPRSDRSHFRFPYLDEGDTVDKRRRVRSYLRRMGYQTAQVTIDYADWAWTSAYMRCRKLGDNTSIAWLRDHVGDSALRHLRQSRLIAKHLFNRDISHVLLVHMGVFTSLSLDAILTRLRAEGVRFVTLDAALRDPVYKLDLSARDECARCHAGPFLLQLARARNITVTALMDATYTALQLAKVCRKTIDVSPEQSSSPD
jgi:peptidoglycan/xylan/chitin deacetylase (PgdA/CDA1 family)